MARDRTKYQTQLGSRYGKDMSPIWSDQNKFQTWRKIWTAVAESQYELEISGVTKEQVEELRAQIENVNYDRADEIERKTRHDVMSHVKAYGEQCPGAAGIIHLGLTSCDVTCNTELTQIHQSLSVVRRKLVKSLDLFAKFAEQYKSLPVLGFTHYQPAQPVSLGKRAAMWAYPLVEAYHAVREFEKTKKLKGLKGATGTQASLLELCHGDERKVEQLNTKFLIKMGYCWGNGHFPVVGQTYPRTYDSKVLGVLADIAEAAHKYAADIRLMQNMKEMEEPFEKEQIGSSAMAYKRNPMKAERICSLARRPIALQNESRMTACVQWLERSLDDSAGRRSYLPESFMAVDEILNLTMGIMERPVVYPAMIKKHLDAEMPFMTTENVLMQAVEKGKSRQDVHEAIRELSQEAGRLVKEEGKDNRLLEMLANDPRIGLTPAEIAAAVDINKFTGVSSSQVDEFLRNYVAPILEAEKDCLDIKSDVRV